MAVFSKYAAVLEADGSPMSVRTALQLINRFLAEDDFDHDTQFCLHWFEQHGWGEGVFGVADVLARAKGTSVDGVKEAGVVPLPPYIHRVPTDRDRDRYQTIFARHPGAVAAPTAGLHFTQELLKNLRAAGVRLGMVTLHVGPGTFKPVTTSDIREHSMDPEWYELPEDTVTSIRETQERGGRVIAVGSTAVRVLETAAAQGLPLRAGAGETNLFLYPGYDFKIVDAMLTNFHLPKSTLFMLVCALAGRERMLEVYRLAAAMRYRFYSYGDAMLIL